MNRGYQVGKTVTVRALAGVLGLAAGALALAGCSRNDVPTRAADPNATSGSRAYADAPMATSSATGSRETTERASYGASGSAGGGYGASYGARAQRAPVPMFEGEPMWSDSRQHTAQENAQYHCQKSGGDIGASSLNDCLKKIHAFLDHPPEDVQKIKRANNGDTLLYDPKENLFAVARRDGAPRTFFKPRDGAQYWKQQQEREASGGATYSRRSTGGGADEG